MSNGSIARQLHLQGYHLLELLNLVLVLLNQLVVGLEIGVEGESELAEFVLFILSDLLQVFQLQLDLFERFGQLIR